jgi:hypothetical protein
MANKQTKFDTKVWSRKNGNDPPSFTQDRIFFLNYPLDDSFSRGTLAIHPSKYWYLRLVMK